MTHDSQSLLSGCRMKTNLRVIFEIGLSGDDNVRATEASLQSCRSTDSVFPVAVFAHVSSRQDVNLDPKLFTRTLSVLNRDYIWIC